MTFLKNLLLLICISFIFTSCVRYEVIDRNKDKETRSISINYKFSQKNKQKIINQKFNKKFNIWLEAECGNGDVFENCAKDEIVFTNKSLMKLNFLKKSENNDNRNKALSTGNLNNSAQNESSHDDHDTPDDHGAPDHEPGGCHGGSDVC